MNDIGNFSRNCRKKLQLSEVEWFAPARRGGTWSISATCCTGGMTASSALVPGPAVMAALLDYDFSYDFSKNRKALPAAGLVVLSAEILPATLRFSGGVMIAMSIGLGLPRFFPRFLYFSRMPMAQGVTWCFSVVLGSFSAISGRSRERTFDHGCARMNADETREDLMTEDREGDEGSGGKRLNDFSNDFFIFRLAQIYRGDGRCFPDLHRPVCTISWRGGANTRKSRQQIFHKFCFAVDVLAGVGFREIARPCKRQFWSEIKNEKRAL
jgi:hypothetical protein